MVCVSAVGKKVPLAIVGVAKKPMCFTLCRGDPPPIKYTNQANAWFDKTVTQWWLKDVFSPYARNKHGDQKCLLH